MSKLSLVVSALVIFATCSQGFALEEMKTGTRVTIRPNEVIPETPKKTIWHVVKKTSEKLRTKNGTLTNFVIPVLELELVDTDFGAIGDKLQFADLGGYLWGSHENSFFILTLDQNKKLKAESYTLYSADITNVFHVDQTVISVLKKEDLPPLKEGYVWVEASIAYEDYKKEPNKISYVLTKEDPDADDTYVVVGKITGASPNEEAFRYSAHCFSELSAIAVRH